MRIVAPSQGDTFSKNDVLPNLSISLTTREVFFNRPQSYRSYKRSDSRQGEVGVLGDEGGEIIHNFFFEISI